MLRVMITVCLAILPGVSAVDFHYQTEPAIEIKAASEWDRLADAIATVESRGDDHAYNASSGALGRWQMKRIYVDEVNRILGLRKDDRKYSYEDRTDPVRAREMFEIYQSHHNPEKDIDRAIRLHRGLDSRKYVVAVKEEMDKSR